MITKSDVQCLMEEFQDRLPVCIVLECAMIRGGKRVREWMFRLGLKLCEWSGIEVIGRMDMDSV